MELAMEPAPLGEIDISSLAARAAARHAKKAPPKKKTPPKKRASPKYRRPQDAPYCDDDRWALWEPGMRFEDIPRNKYLRYEPEPRGGLDFIGDWPKMKPDDEYDGEDEHDDEFPHNHQNDRDHHDEGDDSIPIITSYEATNKKHHKWSQQEWTDAVNEAQMKFQALHPEYAGKNPFDDGLSNQSSTLVQFSGMDGSPAADEAAQNSHYNGHIPVFIMSQLAAIEQKPDTPDPSAMDWCVPPDTASVWKQLDSAAATKFETENLPDADAELLQPEYLVPNGLSWATQPTMDVPEYQPQTISQSFVRPISQQATPDNLMSIDYDDEAGGGPFSNSRSRFTQDLLSELNEIHDGIENNSKMGPPNVIVANKKNLFGPDGLLGPLPSVPRTKTGRSGVKKNVSKKVRLHGLSSRIKQQLADINPTNLFAQPATEIQFSIARPAARHVSLHPTWQSKLYSDFEVMICLAANDFLVKQYQEDRISLWSISKAGRLWSAKNRPQVMQFRFDQATQRQLIVDNCRTIHFYGDFAKNKMRINATLLEWKGIALEMCSRTYCQRDVAIRKSINGIKNVLEMLNAPPETLRAFRNLAHWAFEKMAKPMESCYLQSCV